MQHAMQHSIPLTKPEQSFGFAKSSGFIQKGEYRL